MGPCQTHSGAVSEQLHKISALPTPLPPRSTKIISIIAGETRALSMRSDSKLFYVSRKAGNVPGGRLGIELDCCISIWRDKTAAEGGKQFLERAPSR